MEQAKIPRYPRMPVTIMMEQRGQKWQVIGILPRTGAASGESGRHLVRDDGETRIYQWLGLELPLMPDGCDDYWYNLTSEQPRLYVICQPDAQGGPVPLRVTADQDDAVAAEEHEEWFFQAAMPVPIVLWIKDYVAAHYRPGPRKGKIKGKGGDKYRNPFDARKP
ncbi:MAG: DUF3305 domain-containing protein [Wenzhouxiangella sp.]|nr:MAG: DUF3305 domain-containing protein [Wenzhouxiangella sp.]